VADLLSKFAGRSIAVIGDVMLDQFTIGRVDRISPEAPVPVVKFEREEFRLGGAAYVAHNIAALGGRVKLVGLAGADAGAADLRAALDRAGVNHAGLVIDRERPTTRKVRVVTIRNQQVARIDHELDADADGAIEAALIEQVKTAATKSEAVVLSDYRKGVVTPRVIAAAIEAARQSGAPLLVDPKVPQAERYRGAALITPNHHEAEVMMQTSIRSEADVRRAARGLHDRTGANVVITWGEHGMWVFDAAAGGQVEQALPAAAREVSDVTGAGDTVIAVLALGLAAGGSLLESARLANRAAGIVVGHFGPVALTLAELTGE